MENELLKLILQELQELKELSKETNKRLTNLEKRMDNLEKRMDSLEKRVDNLEKKMEILEEKVDGNTENIETLKDIVMKHYEEFKKFVKYNNLQHKIYDAKLVREDEEEYNIDEEDS